MKLSHCQKYERKDLKNSALNIQGRIFQICYSYFGQWDDSVFSFWNFPTFKFNQSTVKSSEPHNQSAPFSGLQKLEDIESDIVSDKKTISFCSGSYRVPWRRVSFLNWLMQDFKLYQRFWYRSLDPLHTGYIEVIMQEKCGGYTETTFDIKWVIGTYGYWKNQNPGGRFGSTI